MGSVRAVGPERSADRARLDALRSRWARDDRGVPHQAKAPERRDRLFLLATLAQVLLTLLGAAGEKCGLDRTLKANTSAKRTMSLFSQGCFWFEAIPNMPNDRLRKLMQAFGAVIDEHHAIKKAMGVT